MGLETELKLALSPADVDAFQHHRLLGRFAVDRPRSHRLVSRYYDTPDCLLYRHAISFRVRADGEGHVQTLKQKGRTQNGLSHREERQWRLSGPDPAPEKVPAGLWPAGLRKQLTALRPMFRTDFQRTLWHVRLPADSCCGNQTPADIELALDVGCVVLENDDTRQEPILEVELELVKGHDTVLAQLAHALGRRVRLTPSDISKAQRGYRLLGYAGDGRG